MKKTIQLILLFCCLHLFVGCTSLLWGKKTNDRFLSGSDDVITSSVNQVLIHQDTLRGFAKLQNNQHNSPQLMVIGKQFSYIFDSGETEILRFLNSELDPKYWRIFPKQNCNCAIQLKLQDSNNPKILNFSSSVEFIYTKPQLSSEDKHLLEKLSFSMNKEFPSYTVHLTGNVVGLNQEMKNLELQNFSQPYPINMYSYKNQKNIHFGRMLSYIALTPFTLATDVILSPLYLILYLQ